ncbi:hypothetical protein D7T02_34390, partial [Burkholderia cepacia]|nr:hypothetical protein [Burkholderia cepacia]MBX3959026.1 hypothetical protein [Burkholderia cepacia]
GERRVLALARRAAQAGVPLFAVPTARRSIASQAARRGRPPPTPPHNLRLKLSQSLQCPPDFSRET